MKPFFSIIIPTRNRHETLPFAIQTVLGQDFDDYELIISDNCSSFETAAVVNEFKSKKIKYFRSETPLAMSDSWEFALSKANGEYIIIFGDDDGLIKNTLLFLYKIIKETKYSVIRWERVYYSWNNLAPAIFANQLTIPSVEKSSVYNGKKIIKKIINFKTNDYTVLPMLYNSAINYKLIKELKEKSGRVFSSITPDIYSGYAFAFLSNYYLSLNVPITINGGSAASSGIAGGGPSNTISREFKKLIEDSSLNFHPKIPFVRSMPASIIEPFLQLQDALNISEIKINRKKVMNRILNRMRVYSESEKEESLFLIKESCKDNPKLKSYIEKKLKKSQIPIIEYSKSHKPYRIGPSDNSWVFDASKFGITNVFQVSEFVSNFYDYSIAIQDLNLNKETLVKLFYKRFRRAARVLIK